MYGPFPIAVPQFGDSINEPGTRVKRFVKVLSVPCETRTCAVNFPPDVEVYSLQDRLVFNTEPLSFLVQCPEGFVCAPGTFPKVITYKPGTFIFPDRPDTPGFPINLQMTGCQSVVRRTLPDTATPAEINAAMQAIISEVARQQAECDAVEEPPPPTPSPFFTNIETYSSVSCDECETIDYNGILPWYITLDRTNNRLVFATGVIAADTQASADSQAQTFLDGFKASAVESGKLTCVTCTITTASPLPDGDVGVAYSETLTATGTFSTPTWTVISGALPDGLSLSSATGEISGTPTTEETATFTVRATSGAQCCDKEFELEIEAASCGDPNDVSYFGQFGLIATGFSATLPEADFNPVGTGYSIVFATDNAPRVAVVNTHWGESQLFNWFMAWSAESSDLSSFESGVTAFDLSIDKTCNIPVYPNGTITSDISAPGATGPDMGDCEISMTMECVVITDLLTIGWLAPTLNLQGAGTGSASGAGGTFSAEIDNPGGAGDGASLILTGTFVASGNGVGGKLTLTVTDFVNAGAFPRFEIIATSNIDGQVWASLSNNGAWFTGNGVYTIPLVIACTPGSVITISIEIEDSAGAGVQSITLSGVFANWP